MEEKLSTELSISETELIELIQNAKKNGQNTVEVKGIKITIKEPQSFECGILD